MCIKKTILPFLFLMCSVFVYSQNKQSLRYHTEGMQKMNQEEFSEAVSFFNKAIELDSLNSVFYRNRGYCFFRSNKFEKAQKDFLKCLKLGDEKPEDYYFIGLSSEKLKQIDKALEWYNEAILLDSANYEYYHRRGIAQIKTGHFDYAVSDFSSAIELHPCHVSSYTYRGQSHLMLQRRDAACLDWAVVQQLDTTKAVPQYGNYCNGNELSKWYDLDEVSEGVHLEKPRFDGGDPGDFSDYIARNIKYPRIGKAPVSGTAVDRFVIAADGSIDSIKVVHSKIKSLANALHKVIDASEKMWQGGKVNGVPSDYEFTAASTIFVGSQVNEIHSLKTSLKKTIENNDTTKSLELCNDVLEIEPFDENILDIRASLYEFLDDTAAANRDRQKLRNLQRVRFRLDIDALKEGCHTQKNKE